MAIARPRVLYFREGLFQSVVADLITFAVMTGCFAINHYFIGSKFLSIFIVIGVLTWVGKYVNNQKVTFFNKKDLIKYINDTIKD